MGSIDIGADQHSGDVSTVNGSIHIGENAVVGRADTVNGSISVERHATAAKLVTVNGSIHLKEAVRVSGTVQAVNGRVTLADGADVAGTLSNVNGAIRVAAAHVGGLIDTATGDIELGPNAHVDGGIHVEKDTSWFHIWFWSEDTPRVVQSVRDTLNKRGFCEVILPRLASGSITTAMAGWTSSRATNLPIPMIPTLANCSTTTMTEPSPSARQRAVWM